jgi:hypothetical protein
MDFCSSDASEDSSLTAKSQLAVQFEYTQCDEVNK